MEIENMTNTYCQECGKELQSGQAFCPSCGYKVGKRKGGKLSKKHITIGISALVGLALIITLIVVTISIKNSPINQFKRALNDGNWETAISLFNENKTNSKFATKSPMVLKDFVDKTVDEFTDVKCSFDSAKLNLNSIKSIHSVDKATILLENIKTSKSAYDVAEKAVQGKDYYTAINNYKLIITEDKPNYDKSQKATTDCIVALRQTEISASNEHIANGEFDKAVTVLEKVVNGGYADASINTALADTREKRSENVRNTAINEADALTTKGDFLGAYQTLNKVAAEHRNSLFMQRIESEKSSIINDATIKVNSMLSESDYLGAFKLLSALPSDIKNGDINNLINTVSDNYKVDVLNQAENQASSGNYDAAIIILEDANKQISLSEFTTAIKDYSTKNDIAFLQSAKSQVGIKYDKIGKTYYIKPKGLPLDTINLGRSRNVEPLILSSDGVSLFSLAFGFQQDHWIFMDSIIVDCDGKQYDYNVSYSDRRSQVIWGGGIAEWYILSNLPSINDLTELVESMTTAKTVTIRFRGSEGRKDVTIPSSHLNQIKTIWRVSKILDRNGSLISYLK
jgi:tetratricopeptide (TPR) repeat protein